MNLTMSYMDIPKKRPKRRIQLRHLIELDFLSLSPLHRCRTNPFTQFYDPLAENVIYFCLPKQSFLTIMCLNDKLSSTMSWVGSDLFILFAEYSHILLKISVILILLTFIYLVALDLLVNNQLNSSSNSTHHCST